MNLTTDLQGIIVIFGGTGDLTHRKLIPALYNIRYEGLLPANFAIVSVGRREKTQEQYQKELYQSVKKFSRMDMKEELWEELKARIYYRKMDFDETEGYQSLKSFLEDIDNKHKTRGNRIFYLSVSPEYFDIITQQLKRNDMAPNKESWQRLVIEKPFGTNLETARKLNQAITDVFEEKNIYRIDHYLGKEMIQNIMVIRFANAIFENIWSSQYIDNVQISLCETVGVENRGGYYEKSGAIRDMIQNHMLQLLALTAMEPPVNLQTESVRNEKVKVIQALKDLTPEEVAQNVVRGQFGPGTLNGAPVPGYRQEEKISPESHTETFVALKVHINNSRWGNTPFYLRTGKRLPERTTEIVIEFKTLPEILYFKHYGPLLPNLLIIRIQPREGVCFLFNGKKPGAGNEILPVKMDFCQNCEALSNSPEAYERLLMDVIRGDSTLFTRWDEIEASWRFVDSIVAAWRMETPELPNYEAGTWGPEKAYELLSRDHRQWWNL